MMVHEMPKAFGNVGWVIIDELPLDAFMFGVDNNDRVELALDALRELPPPQLSKKEAKALRKGRDDLHKVLDKIVVPIDRHRGAPVSHRSLDFYSFGGLGGFSNSARHLRTLEWKGKVEPKLQPDMSRKQVLEAVGKVTGNKTVAAERHCGDWCTRPCEPITSAKINLLRSSSAASSCTAAIMGA